MAKIKKIIAREILDSRGYPTIECAVILDDNSTGTFSTPSGSSVGKHEAKELRDEDEKRLKGLGVLKALKNIADVLGPAIIGKDAQNQSEIDTLAIGLDGTQDKSKLGANAILAISGAVCRAASISQKVPLYQYIAALANLDTHHFTIPTPMFNVLNGGKHGSGNLDFQEFLVIPLHSNNYSQNLKFGLEVYYALKETVKTHSGTTLVGDEGGYAPTLYSNADAFKILEEAIAHAGYHTGLDAFLGVDVAASNLKFGNAYKIKDRPVELSPNDFVDFYIALNESAQLLSIEDPFEQDDWDQWTSLNEKIGGKTLIVGDDLITTNMERLKKAIATKACGGIVIKPNQIGTITETLEVEKAAKQANLKLVVSHRSGETNDDFIADFAVGIGGDYVKFGAPARGERVAKYNRLLEIEHDLS